VIVQIDTTRFHTPSASPSPRHKACRHRTGSAQSTGFGVLRGIPKGSLPNLKAFVLTVLHTEEVSLGYEYQLFLGTRDTVHQLGANMVRSQSQFLDLGEPHRKTEFPDLAPQFSEVERA